MVLCVLLVRYTAQISLMFEFSVYLKILLFVHQKLKGHFLYSETHDLFLVWYQNLHLSTQNFGIQFMGGRWTFATWSIAHALYKWKHKNEYFFLKRVTELQDTMHYYIYQRLIWNLSLGYYFWLLFLLSFLETSYFLPPSCWILLCIF